MLVVLREEMLVKEGEMVLKESWCVGGGRGRENIGVNGSGGGMLVVREEEMAVLMESWWC